MRLIFCANHTRAWEQYQVFRMKQTKEQSEIHHKVLVKTKQIGFWKASKRTGRIFCPSLICLPGTKPSETEKRTSWRAVRWFSNQLWFVSLRTSGNVDKIQVLFGLWSPDECLSDCVDIKTYKMNFAPNSHEITSNLESLWQACSKMNSVSGKKTASQSYPNHRTVSIRHRLSFFYFLS